MLPEFDLLRPRDLPEALTMMAREPVLPIAGGTNLIVELRDGLGIAAKLMDVSRLRELRGIRRENGHVVVGGGTTITELLQSPIIAAAAKPLHQAAALLGNPLVRNRATIAGNLVNASPAADTAPPLLALGAEVELAGAKASRWVTLDEFMVGVNKTVREPDELLTSIRWPAPPAHSAAGFYKIGLRKADACSVINAAVMVVWDEAGRCTQARIAIGAAAPRPIRARTAEAALLAQPLDPEVTTNAARLAAGDTAPIDDIRGSASYRRRMAEVMVRRLLAQTAELQAGRRSQS